VRAFDNVESRGGYSGLYQFGASYNPGRFTTQTSTKPMSGDYLLYWMASQALWRVDPKGGKGLDATFAYDWSPGSINRNNTMITAGLRFNEPLPLRIHHTMSLGYVQNRLSPVFVPPGGPAWKPEQALEFNSLLDIAPMLLTAAGRSILRERGWRNAARRRSGIQNQGRIIAGLPRSEKAASPPAVPFSAGRRMPPPPILLLPSVTRTRLQIPVINAEFVFVRHLCTFQTSTCPYNGDCYTWHFAE
jgi:hypothetical protein